MCVGDVCGIHCRQQNVFVGRFCCDFSRQLSFRVSTTDVAMMCCHCTFFMLGTSCLLLSTFFLCGLFVVYLCVTFLKTLAVSHCRWTSGDLYLRGPRAPGDSRDLRGPGGNPSSGRVRDLRARDQGRGLLRPRDQGPGPLRPRDQGPWFFVKLSVANTGSII